MGLMESLENAVGEVVNTVENKAHEITDTARIKNNIKTETNAMNQAYMELGKLVYQKYQSGQGVEPQYEGYCRKVTECRNNLNNLNKQLETVKGK